MANLPLINDNENYPKDPACKTDCWSQRDKDCLFLALVPIDEKKEIERELTFGQLSEDDVPIPWKWNKLEMFKEVISVKPKLPDFQKSCEVDSHKFFYRILLDVRHFTPEDLTITLTDRTVMIRGNHKKTPDHFCAGDSRSFTWKYVLPADARMDLIRSHLSSDGMLHLTAPKVYVDLVPHAE